VITDPSSPRETTRSHSTRSDELEALRRGDQAAFVALVQRLHPGMVRVASSYVSSRAVAEEVAQDTWLAVIQQLDRFEGRSSLQTWIFRILINQAKSRGVRERRTLPFSAMGPESVEAESTLPAESFLPEGHRWAGHWATPVHDWQLPDEAALSAELGGLIREAVDALAPNQRAVVALRDGQGLSSEEVCDLLGISPGNQRVLLHRGRTRIRAAISRYVERDEVPV